MILNYLINKKIGSYSLYFFIFLILSKVVYLFFESLYNFNTLNASSDITVLMNINQFKDIEKTGYQISSIGITLLVMPFIYLLLTKVLEIENEKYIFLLIIIIGVFSYFLTYKFQERIKEKIIENNSNIRYEAYYTNILRYAILENKFRYEKFIEKNKDFKNDISSKVLLANIFVLTLINKDVVDIVLKKSSSELIDIYIKNIDNEKYDKVNKNIISLAKKIKSDWDIYINSKKHLNTTNKSKLVKYLEKVIGIKNISLKLKWPEFVKLYESEINKELNSKQYTHKLVSLIIDGKMNKFYSEIYKPLFYDEYSKNIIYKKEDFYKNSKAIEFGNNAIKSLVILPYALTISLIVGILNVLSIITMILLIPIEYITIIGKNIIKVFIKTNILLIIITTIYINGNKNDYINKNRAIKQINFKDNLILEYYIKNLNSIILLEKLNIKLHNKINN